MRHVLIVDDEAEICRTVKVALERDGAFRVSFALNAREAIPLLEEPPPDLVIIDPILPGIAGMELAELALGRRIAVLLTTGDGDRAQALQQDGWMVLRKPFDLVTLRQDVAAALRGVEAAPVLPAEPPAQGPGERRDPRRDPRAAATDAQTRSLLEEDSDIVRAAFHMLENFGDRAAQVADQRARDASAADVAKRWVDVARAIRKLRPKL
ncbi:MAG TPA: response regulator [Stellaceae bacterium]|nr:response regulator [Stellaceae bacterium]